jgi:hypothetical protein
MAAGTGKTCSRASHSRVVASAPRWLRSQLAEKKNKKKENKE